MWTLFAALLTGSRPEAEPDEAIVQALVAAAAADDMAAADRIYSLYVQRVFRVVRPLCGAEAEAEDVTQDAFVKALTSLKRYRRRGNTRFVAWLVTIALNTARIRVKRRARLRSLPPGLLEAMARRSGDTAPDAERLLVEEGERQRLRRLLLAALDELSVRDREVMVLRYGAGLPAPEVAALVGLDAANVRKICQRQRAGLLAMLQAGEATEAARAEPGSSLEVRS